MEHTALSGSFGAGATPAMTLQQAVFAGIVNPGQLRAVRELTRHRRRRDTTSTRPSSATRGTPTRSRPNANGSLTVDNNGGTDGIDTLCQHRASAVLGRDGQRAADGHAVDRDARVRQPGREHELGHAPGDGHEHRPRRTSCSRAASRIAGTQFAIVEQHLHHPRAERHLHRSACSSGRRRPGAASATLNINGAAPAAPASVALTGTGIAAPVAPGVPPGTPTVTRVPRTATFTVSWTAPTTGAPSRATTCGSRSRCRSDRHRSRSVRCTRRPTARPRR